MCQEIINNVFLKCQMNNILATILALHYNDDTLINSSREKLNKVLCKTYE